MVVMFKVKAVHNSSESQQKILNVTFTSSFKFNTTKECFSTVILQLLIKNGLHG